MIRIRFFYPVLGFVVSAIIIIFVWLPPKEWIDAFALGYTAIFILSMLEAEKSTIIASAICGYGIIKQNDRQRFPAAKGSLIIGKQVNIFLTAVINIIAGITKLAT